MLLLPLGRRRCRRRARTRRPRSHRARPRSAVRSRSPASSSGASSGHDLRMDAERAAHAGRRVAVRELDQRWPRPRPDRGHQHPDHARRRRRARAPRRGRASNASTSRWQWVSITRIDRSVGSPREAVAALAGLGRDQRLARRALAPRRARRAARRDADPRGGHGAVRDDSPSCRLSPRWSRSTGWSPTPHEISSHLRGLETVLPPDVVDVHRRPARAAGDPLARHDQPRRSRSASSSP